jgi:hypothetical protein
MLALIGLMVMAAGLAVAWRRFGLARCRLRRVVVVAELGGFHGALAFYAMLRLQPSTLLIALSDGLLLFPLLILTGSSNEIVLTLLAPLLLLAEFSVVIFCVLFGLRQVLGPSGRTTQQTRRTWVGRVPR